MIHALQHNKKVKMDSHDPKHDVLDRKLFHIIFKKCNSPVFIMKDDKPSNYGTECISTT